MPGCGCASQASLVRDGSDSNGRKRFRCRKCRIRFGILSGTALSSCKPTLWQAVEGDRVHDFQRALDAVADVAGYHHNTALLTRRKVFETVASWQSAVRLSGVVFIDEVFVFDSMRPQDHFGPKPRGLSRDKCCVFLAVGQYLDMAAVPRRPRMPGVARDLRGAAAAASFEGGGDEDSPRRPCLARGRGRRVGGSSIVPEDGGGAQSYAPDKLGFRVGEALSQPVHRDGHRIPAGLPQLVCVPLPLQVV